MWNPAGHRVIVKPDDPPEKIGQIFVPPWVKENKAFEIIKGTIVSVGMTAWRAFDEGKPWANVGDRVMFAKYGGSIVEDEAGVKYRILNDEDIIAVWEE
jgi:co-chaperonin GroES (HSP10)